MKSTKEVGFSIFLATSLIIILMLNGCGKIADSKETVAKTQTENNIVESVEGSSTVISEESTEMGSETELLTKQSEDASNVITLGFAGDMNLDEEWATTQYLNQQENGIYSCISPELIEECNNMDVFMLNNEFTYSLRGEPTEGKMYTFRADPDRVSILKALGVDIVLLANNHIYDYGADAFEDTLTTLEKAEIHYVGAGRDMEEASAPVYLEVDGVKIGYVAATRAEKIILTPEAGESSPGVLRTYDSEKYLEAISEAAKNCDYVVASVHFGTEYSNQVEDYQKELAHAMIDAGADAVIGTHPHILQGMEYYAGKPIIYSLGNFWFNEKDIQTGVLELYLSTSDMTLKQTRFIPCLQSGCQTRLPEEDEMKRKYLDYMEDISFSVKFDNNGIVVEK